MLFSILIFLKKNPNSIIYLLIFLNEKIESSQRKRKDVVPVGDSKGFYGEM